MGNKRRVLRSFHGKKKIAMSDTNMAINGCKVFVGHPDPAHAAQTAKKFAGAFPAIMARSKVPNMQDFYRSHFEACAQMKAGEPLSS